MADYLLIFDGGSISNPKLGYGSYQITAPNGQSRLRRLEFGPGVSNNQAEYMALIAGLRDILGCVEAAGGSPAESGVEVQGDSALVINQLTGRWKVRDPALKRLHAEAKLLLEAFGRARLVQIPRAVSRRVLGH